MIDVENLSEGELDILHSYFQELVKLAKKDQSMTESHSMEEAQRLHEEQS